MNKYIKKPIKVEALQIHGNVSEIKEFIGENGDAYKVLTDTVLEIESALDDESFFIPDGDDEYGQIDDAVWRVVAGRPRTVVMIHTLEGIMRATDGDYIIKGVKGEFYPCRKDIFEETYELAESEQNDDIEAMLERLWNNTADEESEVENDGKSIRELMQIIASEDAISRQAVDELSKELVHTTRDKADFLCNFWESLQKLPSVTSQPKTVHWIPVSERLPNDLEPVNISWVNHNPEGYYADIKDKPFTATAVYFNGQWYWWSTLCIDILAEYSHNYDDVIDDAIEIIAWQPLPQPYVPDINVGNMAESE